MKTKSSFIAASLILSLLFVGASLALLDGGQSRLPPVYADGINRYVAVNGIDTGGCTGATAPCRSIQYAIDQASPDDSILVAAGVYSPDGAQAVAEIAKSLTLRGGYSTADNFGSYDPEANPTVLDAGRTARGVYIHNEGVRVTLENLRVTGGDAAGLSAYPGYGGGVLVARGLSGNNVIASIDHCTIVNNTANSSGDGYGGGVAVYRHATANISNSRILSNTATGGSETYGYGGGIASNNFTTLNLSNSLVQNNLASDKTGYGGGIYLNGYPSSISSNDILSNTASTSYGGYGGGIYLNDNSVLEENIIKYNRVTESGTWGQGGGVCLRSSSGGAARRNLVQGNSAHYGGGISYEDEDIAMDGNRILDNNAAERGGGLYIVASSSSNFDLDNLVIAGNAGAKGAGIYLASGRPTLRHLTLAGNDGGDATGLYIAEYGGALIWTELESSIVADQDVGIYIASTEEATANSTLWYEVASKSSGSGVLTDNDPLGGDPSFTDPAAGDYHITGDSAAKDGCAGAGLDHDMENDPRPGGLGPDCGADEIMESGLVLTKQAGQSLVGLDETLTYTLRLEVVALDVHNLVLTDTLDSYQEPVAMTAGQGSCNVHDPSWGGSVVCDVGTVAAGETIPFTLTARTTSSAPPAMPQTITNRAAARGDEAEAEAEAGLELQNCRVRLVEGSSETIYTGVQAAIDAASYITSEVQVAGSCLNVETRNGHTQIVYLDKSLTLRGGYSQDFASWDPDVYPAVLDARQQGRGIYLSGAGITTTIEALHITGGVGENIGSLSGEMYNTGGYYAGGGIYAGPGVQAVISNCHIYENRGLGGSPYVGSVRRGMGGGVMLQGAGVTLRNNQIVNNVASIPLCESATTEYGYGGGVAMAGASSSVLVENFFHDNIGLQGACAQGFGGGVFMLDSSARVFTNTLTGNIAGTATVYACDGGGMMVDGGSPTIRGNTLSTNTASQGWEGLGGGLFLSDSQALLDQNTFQDNVASGQGGSGYGGGAALYDGDRSTLTANQFLFNAANDGNGIGVGGGVRIYESGPVMLTGNVFQGNYAARGEDGRGGGVSLCSNSSAVLSNNEIKQNSGSLDSWGAGGGVYIESDSTATLERNLILANTAAYTVAGSLPGSGGGVALVEVGAVELVSNTIWNNLACTAAGGRGGGLYVQGSSAVAMKDNLVTGNNASAAGTGRGGGLFLSFESSLASTGNTWQENVASTSDSGEFGDYGYGGGLYLDEDSAMTAVHDAWLENTASAEGVAYGGGLYVEDGGLTLVDSAVLTNTTGSGEMSGHGYGGGLYATGSAAVKISRTSFVSNTAFEAGGGLYLEGDSLWFTNTLIVRNHAGWEGAGVSVYSPAQFIHATIADNTGAEGIYASDTTLFTNTIIAGHSLGIYADGRVELSNVLWHNNDADKEEDWGVVLAGEEYWGDPRFVDPENGDYHPAAGSAAIDRAAPSTVADDLDGKARPFGGAAELGAYETHADFTLSPGYDVFITPGEPVTLTHTLRNNGPAADTYTLTWSAGRGWSELVTASPVTAGAGEAVSVQVRTAAPEDAEYGLFETVYLTATSHTEPAMTAAPINRMRVGLGGDVSLAPARSSTVMAGETVAYTHTLTNNTNAPQAFSLTGSSSEWYDVHITPSTTGALSAFGGSALVTVTIETSIWEISGTIDATTITATGSLGSAAQVTDLTTILEPDNYPPTADAGEDQVVSGGAVVILDGSGSSDLEDDLLTYQWQQTGGTPTVALTPHLSVTTFIAPSTASVLTFTLTVEDSGGLTDEDTVVVMVKACSIYLPLVIRQ